LRNDERKLYEILNFANFIIGDKIVVGPISKEFLSNLRYSALFNKEDVERIKNEAPVLIERIRSKIMIII